MTSAQTAFPAGADGTSDYHEVLTLRRGGSATISLAIAHGIAGFRKLVVLKTLDEDSAEDDSAVEMFLDEARISAHMNHANVVHVYQVLERSRLPAIVMEYLDGQSLASILQSAVHPARSVPLDVSLTILAKTLSGLHYAHALQDFSGKPLNLVHRDVSPTNVMVTYDGRVKLLDFGIAKFSASAHRTHPQTIRGKLRYMAPEQLRSLCDRRSDVFAAGVMLWETLALRRFWGGDAAEPEIMARLLAGDLPRLSAVSRDIDPELEQICMKAVAVDPEHRYATAADMQAELERYLLARNGIVPEAAVGSVVAEVCAELRTREHSLIRQHLSEVGLALSEPGGSSSLIGAGSTRPKDGAERRRREPPFARVALVGLGLVVSGVPLLSSVRPSRPGASEDVTANALQAPPTALRTPSASVPARPAKPDPSLAALSPRAPSAASALPLASAEPAAVSATSSPESSPQRSSEPELERRESEPAKRQVARSPRDAFNTRNAVRDDHSIDVAEVQPGNDLRRLRSLRPIDEEILR
jgi:eukaryotic-like serine/threonine-protein kinase